MVGERTNVIVENWRVDLQSWVGRIDVLVVDVEVPLGRLGEDLRSGILLCRLVAGEVRWKEERMGGEEETEQF